ncbi:hypothetical protein JDV02_002520 [Purpureocillium takamizusanense]|uniref:Centrosomin N-terminal motif 1 domain-containing protein n=1 Tax=Purpureocillium takamizusanense TaxID=2060973 RepID=A0A9Q8Q8V2_9HYPO|nr:uncharacterized protein JDV02_002520 [Purpureocillium takamizusanense]UNI16044.1 hypothetical protein JDV02_002520 [Purpureocillium takamizusanense]
MEGPNSYQQPRRASRPSYPRAPSRPTSASNSRLTASHSVGSSISHVAVGGPPPTHAQPAPRLHHTHNLKQSSLSPRPSSSRGVAHPSRQETPDSARHRAMSSFLQEKLQRERAENERISFSASLSRTDMSASVDVSRAVYNSPFRPPQESEGGRPQSSAGVEPRRKGLGVKEMEQVVSNLHKQNFDLKLELFHRRERQSALEERLDGLESDRKQMEDVNDKLMEELEKRDKAVEEAVAMILMLEAKVNQLLQEREMVQQVERQDFFCARDYDLRYDNSAMQTPKRHDPRSDPDVKVVTRMPSFISEPNGNTENLRNVYLGAKTGGPALPRVTEGSPEADHQALGSPTLSVLSESSFVSVYGQKPSGKEADLLPPARIDEPLTLDGLDAGLVTRREEMPAPRRRAASVTKATSGFRPPPRSSTAVPFQSMSGVVGYDSPLQRIERLDSSYTKKDGISSQSQGRTIESQFAPPKSTARKQTKEEKREALRRVMTDAPGGVRLHDQGLPPTPDTISTSTLHRFKNSHETLSQPPEVCQDEGSHGVSLHSISQEPKSAEPASGVPLGDGSSLNASDKMRSVSASSYASYQHQQHAQRPRSAGESVVSRREDNGWDSDDDNSDARSLQSSLDIWLRESSKPAKRDASGRRVSPDLFSFPNSTAKGGWAVDSMLGPSNTHPGGPNAPAGYDHVQDLLAVQNQLFSSSTGPPPPPNRRSSLHATTGSRSDSLKASSSNSPSLKDNWRSSPKTRGKHSTKNSEDLRSGDEAKTPVQQKPRQPPPEAGSDQKRYPPITGHQGARAGLNRLFRRSIGSSSSNAPPPEPASSANSVAESSSSETRTQNPMGVPSWVLRNCPIEDERSGATPPPIMLNPRQGRRSTLDSTGDKDRPVSPTPAEALDKTTVDAQTQEENGEAKPQASQQDEGGAGTGGQGAPTGTGARRKWLPFGRNNNAKNKTG